MGDASAVAMPSTHTRGVSFSRSPVAVVTSGTSARLLAPLVGLRMAELGLP